MFLIRGVVCTQAEHVTHYGTNYTNSMSASLFLLAVEYWDLMHSSEKYDKIPELWEGHNIADYIDPDIMKVCVRLSEVQKVLNLLR